MNIVTNFKTGVIAITMNNHDTQIVEHLTPKKAKLIGEALISNGNKMLEYKSREDESEEG